MRPPYKKICRQKSERRPGPAARKLGGFVFLGGTVLVDAPTYHGMDIFLRMQ